MSLFGRNLAPVSKEALAEIDAQAARSICAQLSVRRFADVKGPHGLEYSAVPLGRMEVENSVAKDVCAGVRAVLPLIESRIAFELAAWEMHDIDRGAKDPDFAALEAAAIKIAAFEENVLYNGHKKAGVKGLIAACENKPVPVMAKEPEKFLSTLEATVCDLKTRAGVCGPYALVGGRKLHEALGKFTDGLTLYKAVKKYTSVEEIIYSPHYDGAMLVSTRGGDIELSVGFDYTVGYSGRKGAMLEFFIGESFTLQVIEPRAYVPLVLK